MRNTKEGDDMSKEGQKAFLETTMGTYIRNGDEAIQEAVSGMSRTGMTKSALAQIKEINNAMKSTRDEEPKK
jgi:hypothetical protein